MPQRDPVTHELHDEVIRRDGGCVAPRLGATGACRTFMGYPMSPTETWRLELDHVKDQPMLGRRAPSDAQHLVALCNFHHQHGWATRNRPLMRAYLAALDGRTSMQAATLVLAEWRQDTGRVYS